MRAFVSAGLVPMLLKKPPANDVAARCGAFDGFAPGVLVGSGVALASELVIRPGEVRPAEENFFPLLKVRPGQTGSGISRDAPHGGGRASVLIKSASRFSPCLRSLVHYIPL